MKQLTLNGKEWLFVEVPEGASAFEAFSDVLKFEQTNAASIRLYRYMELLPGHWSDPIKASEVTEEQANGIVEKNQYGHKGWKTYTEKNMFWENSATESLYSLIRSLGMDVDKTLILKKIK